MNNLGISGVHIIYKRVVSRLVSEIVSTSSHDDAESRCIIRLFHISTKFHPHKKCIAPG